MSSPRIAACQVLDRQDDLSGAVATIRQRARESAAAGAEVVCFPEGYLVGYTRDRVIAQRRALDLSSGAFRAILRDLKACTPWLVIGLIERCGQSLFNTAVVIKSGQLIGAYRKRHPHESIYAAGDDLPMYDAGSLRFGIGICSDARDCVDAAHLERQRVDAILYPLNNMLPTEIANQWRDRHLAILTQRAKQTSAWIISADVIGAGDGMLAYGCTAAVDPTGTVRQQINESHTGTLIATLD